MPNDDDDDDESDSDDLFTRPGPTGDVHWSDDEGDDNAGGRRRRRRREDDDDDAKEAERLTTTTTIPVPTDTKKNRIEKQPSPLPDDDDDDDAWAREALLESATTPAMKPADTDGARALLRALDGLARPPSPTYVPTVRGTNATMTTTMSIGLGGTRPDSNGRRRDEAAALDDEDEDEDEPVGMSDSERVDEDLGATTTRNDDDGGADEFTGEMMTVYFQLPNGKKYERVVGSQMPFRSIVAAWKRSADWADVEETLGSASVKLLFDGDVIPGTKTPTQMEMEEDDTVDVMRG